MPFVHHHQLEVLEQLRGIVAGEQERQAFRCGDEGGGKAPALPGSDPGRGVAGAGLDGPGEAEVFDRGEQRGLGVRSECSKRSDPENAQRRAPLGCPPARCPLPRRIIPHPLQHRPHPGRVGLAGAGGGVDQPALTGEIRPPDLLLELERLPAFGLEPLADALDRLPVAAVDGRRGLGSAWAEQPRLRRPSPPAGGQLELGADRPPARIRLGVVWRLRFHHPS